MYTAAAGSRFKAALNSKRLTSSTSLLPCFYVLQACLVTVVEKSEVDSSPKRNIKVDCFPKRRSKADFSPKRNSNADSSPKSKSKADSAVDSDDTTTPLILKQRTGEWHELRQDRLTASTFATALGFFGNFRRSELWAQKLGLIKPFPGNTATDWGIRREAEAIKKYQEFTGFNVSYLAFKVYKQGDESKDWIGGSPDGLVEPVDVPNCCEGILEVKCPYNQGQPQLCVPWSEVPYYYMPQLQGLMEVLDRQWLDIFAWTMNGSALFRVERNPEYWELIFDVLNDFWFGSVVPAKKALARMKDVDVNVFKPILRHKATPVAIKESKQLARRSVLIEKFLV